LILYTSLFAASDTQYVPDSQQKAKPWYKN